MCLGPGTPPPPPAILKYSSDPGPSCWRKILDTCMHALSTEKIIKVQMHASICVEHFFTDPPPRSSSRLTTFTRVYYNTSAYMQHKVWISMNYILIPGFFPYQQRRGESFGQSRDVFCFGSRRNYQQIAFMVLWQKNKEYSLAYLKIPFSHENKEQICFICIEKYNEISNFWI